jgi:hypothetical protein
MHESDEAHLSKKLHPRKCEPRHSETARQTTRSKKRRHSLLRMKLVDEQGKHILEL